MTAFLITLAVYVAIIVVMSYTLEDAFTQTPATLLIFALPAMLLVAAIRGMWKVLDDTIRELRDR